MFDRHQLETPGKYTQLTALYNDRKAELRETSPSRVMRPSPVSTPSTPSQELLPEMKVCVAVVWLKCGVCVCAFVVDWLKSIGAVCVCV